MPAGRSVPSAHTIGDVGVQRREVVERRRRAVGPGAALEEPRLHLGRARRAPPDRRAGRGTPTARTRPAPRAPSRSSAAGCRTTRAPSRGRPTPPAACAPSPTCGSRRPAPGRPPIGGHRDRLAQEELAHQARVQPVDQDPGAATRATRRASPPRRARGGRASPPRRRPRRRSRSRRRSWARRWCRGPAGRRPPPGGRRVRARASGSNTPAQKPFGCRSTSGGPSPPQSSAPMVSPSCSTDHRCGSRGRPSSGARYQPTSHSTGRPIARVGYPAGHADRSRKPLAL